MPNPEYDNYAPTCKGDWMLGTACGKCARCVDSAPEVIARYRELLTEQPKFPVPMRLPCPSCGKLHLDEGEFAAKEHHTHACQYCGMVWRPAVVSTVGVAFLPGFKNET